MLFMHQVLGEKEVLHNRVRPKTWVATRNRLPGLPEWREDHSKFNGHIRHEETRIEARKPLGPTRRFVSLYLIAVRDSISFNTYLIPTYRLNFCFDTSTIGTRVVANAWLRKHVYQ